MINIHGVSTAHEEMDNDNTVPACNCGVYASCGTCEAASPPPPPCQAQCPCAARAAPPPARRVHGRLRHLAHMLLHDMVQYIPVTLLFMHGINWVIQ